MITQKNPVAIERDFYLDWNKDTLYIFEEEKSVQTIEAIMKGIEQGHNFPAVPVDRVGKNKFTLTGAVDELGWGVGGHNRSVAHYLAGKPLKCFLWTDRIEDEPNYERMPTVENISLVDDSEDYEWRKRTYPGYL